MRLANNPRISAWHAQLNVLLHGRRLLRTHDVGAVPESVLQRIIRSHREIGQAIEWRDTTAAEATITTHIETHLAVLNAPGPPAARGARRRRSDGRASPTVASLPAAAL